MTDQKAGVEQAPAVPAAPVAETDRRPTRHGGLTDVVVILAVFVAVGLVCGALWWLLVDPATFTKTRGGGGSMGEPELAKRFNADGWYAVIAAVVGLLSGGLVTWWRSRDYLLTTVLITVGAAVAAAVMAVTGHLLGPGAPEAALALARPGQHVPVQLGVTARAAYLIWPIGVLFGGLFVLWSAPRGPAGDADNEFDELDESAQI